MSPLNEQQLTQIRDDRREQIKKAALTVFARHGIAGTKMSMIAAEAGISQGLFYRYYSSKDSLFTALVQELMEEAGKEIVYITQIPGTPMEQIKALTKGMLDEDNKHAFMLIQQARKTDDVPKEVKQALEKHSPNVLIDLLVPIFIKGQQTGEFSEGDPRELLSWYFNIINSLIMQEQENEEYGFPSVDILIRIITK
ncbi:TetR/AcrR family transcriptional regulator [Paenibacillus sp. Soil787]|uniref:TetR/AcrR family transcriptional regulator n=1 Tax=Paenibacillus sp. Soil787 TaxID=1736411 RepID=UPI0007028577|nr:TetR/AcrR family transcriptional regulator [Paenibacillus sp. Soil787]KRF20049.1 TetR family transcriptional regulator [Paenibacillus sp. Soil787]